MNETIRKFGYPETLVREYDRWLVLLRPKQVTLGSLVLAAKSEATAFSGLDRAAFSELAAAVRDIEATLRRLFDYQKINYLMLMMVDPNVHFHVLPRYAGAKRWEGRPFGDPGWPGPPDLTCVNETSADENRRLAAFLRESWVDESTVS